jgi:hypothetical protein
MSLLLVFLNRGRHPTIPSPRTTRATGGCLAEGAAAAYLCNSTAFAAARGQPDPHSQER